MRSDGIGFYDHVFNRRQLLVDEFQKKAKEMRMSGGTFADVDAVTQVNSNMKEKLSLAAAAYKQVKVLTCTG